MTIKSLWNYEGLLEFIRETTVKKWKKLLVYQIFRYSNIPYNN